jgi:hypothetical protein
VDDLIAFVRRCLDAEEQVAQKAAAFPYELPTDAPWERERIIADSVGGNSRAVATHRIVAVFADPKRVLADIEAKRRLLNWVEGRIHDAEDFPDDTRYQLRAYEARTLHLRWLALPYAGEPGFRDEWRP